MGYQNHKIVIHSIVFGLNIDQNVFLLIMMGTEEVEILYKK